MTFWGNGTTEPFLKSPKEAQVICQSFLSQKFSQATTYSDRAGLVNEMERQEYLLVDTEFPSVPKTFSRLRISAMFEAIPEIEAVHKILRDMQIVDDSF